MFPRAFTPLELDASTSQAPADRFTSTLPSTFGRMIQPSRLAATFIVHDRCKRPEPIYNYKYNHYTLILGDIDAIYSLYVYRKTLYDDRAAIVANLPQQHTLAGAAKRQRTFWVWNLGYALIDNSKISKPLMWACKLCMYKSKYLYLVLLIFLG
jgi:hypothetical protein